MRIVTVNEYRVEVTLTPEELDGFDITYEQLDYGNADTRRGMWTLLSEIRRVKGVDLDLSGKLLIEVRKEHDGLCRVCFTSLPAKEGQAASVKQLVKTETPPVLLETVGLDDAVRAASFCPPEWEASLYRRKNVYRLALRVRDDETEKARLRLCEFGDLITPAALSAAVCEERWQKLAEGNAVSLLRRLI